MSKQVAGESNSGRDATDAQLIISRLVKYAPPITFRSPHLLRQREVRACLPCALPSWSGRRRAMEELAESGKPKEDAHD